MDLAIFKSDSNQCFHQTNNDISILQCDHLQRMLTALKYYKTLKMNSTNPSNNTNELFMDFCDNGYTQFLNDYQHGGEPQFFKEIWNYNAIQ